MADSEQRTTLLGAADDRPTDKYQADLVLVFPRPPKEEGEPLKFTANEVDEMFDEILIARDKNADPASPAHGVSEEAGIGDAYPCCTALETKLGPQGSEATVTLEQVQDAVIEDMINFLSDQGCYTDAFMSIDKDQLFLLISLGDPSKTAQECKMVLPTAQENGLRLQTTFNTDTLPRLGIKQTLMPNAEAYMAYSASVTATSLKAFKFNDPASNGQTLFKRYNAGTGGVHGTILRTVDRVRVLKMLLNQFMDVEDAKGSPILDDYYVPHNMQKLDGFRSGYVANPDDVWDDAHDAWANFRLCTIMKGLPLKEMMSGNFLLSVTAGQPIQDIRNYFGEQIAFYFLWLGYTTQASFFALFPAVVLAYGFSVTQIEHEFADPNLARGLLANLTDTLANLTDTLANLTETEGNLLASQTEPFDCSEEFDFARCANGEQKEQAVFNAIFSLSAVTLYCIGGILYVKGWVRLENYYRCLWDPTPAGAASGHRPDYVGPMVPNPVNENKKTKVDPVLKANCRRLTTTTVLVVFIAAVIAAVAGVYYLQDVLREEYGIEDETAESIVSMLFTLQITIFQLIWDAISQQLVEISNPRTDEEAKDLSVQFLFPFSFVSTYANIFFHAFFKSWGKDCMEMNCLHTMRPALFAVVCPALAIQVVSMLIPYALYRYSLHAEKQAMTKKGETAPDRAFIESQAKRQSFEVTELNKEMNIMMILLGYVLLFGFAAPAIALFIFVAFLVKIRVDAFKLCSVYQRVIPQMQFTGGGIGEWNDVLKSLVKIAQWTCIAVPVFNLEYFHLFAQDNLIVRVIVHPDYWLNNEGGLAYDSWLDQEGVAGDRPLSTTQKLMLTFIFKELIDRLCSFIDYGINDHSSAELLMSAKRGKVHSSFTTKVSAIDHKAQVNSEGDKAERREIQEAGEVLITQIKAKPSEVPRLVEKEGAREKFNWKDFAVATNKETYFGKGDGYVCCS